MADPHTSDFDVILVEEDLEFTLADLCRACHVATTQVTVLVDEGVLAPAGSGPGDWRFSGSSLRRARIALRLAQDLELDIAATALVLHLLDEIEALRSQLRRIAA